MDSITSPKYQFLCAVLFLLSIQTRVFCFQYQVADLNCWSAPPAGNPYIFVNWTNNNYFNPGDSLFFLYPPSQDSVLQVTQQAYQTCDTSSPIYTMNDGNSVFGLVHGTFFFISGNEANCRNNQKLQVCVPQSGTCASYTPPLPPLPPSPATSPSGSILAGGSISTAPSSSPTSSPSHHSSSWSITSPMVSMSAVVGLLIWALLME
ncbi:hypothetical protein Vadar_017464 [Vaccinium darrowii]|uniref:Uncharacterized protein n=1 Tax=Vaccinium darrowii TaxID=229202 RepID=A0ACB7XI74_9ERIC|nr:hypothetical protein Vadar_017464 [Vaccinium darrowii]